MEDIIRRGNIPALEARIAAGSSLDEPEGVDKMTALHYAVQYGAEPVVDFLLSKGVNVNAQSSDGNTPLLIATGTDQVNLVQKLLDKGADPNIKNLLGDTALFYASEAVIPLLVAKGADVNAEGSNGMTPLHSFAMKNRYKSMQILLKSPAISVSKQDAFGNTPLHIAALKGYTEIATLLLSRNAQTDILNKSGKIPLSIATGEVKSILAKTTEKWAGFTKTDMQFFNEIFQQVSTNGLRGTLEDVSFCPCCLSLNRREYGCNYIPKHVCVKGDRHERLYNLYKTVYYSIKGSIVWCSICGRISDPAAGNVLNFEKHYTLSDGTETQRVEMVPNVGNIFANDCRPFGGGGVQEKLRRFYWLIRKAAELQPLVGKIQFQEAKAQLVEACWGARPIPSSANTSPEKMIAQRSLGVLPAVFTDEVSIPASETITEYAPDVPTPNTMEETTTHECSIELGPHPDNRPTYVLVHNVVNKETGAVEYTNRHDEQAICIEDILNMMQEEGYQGRCPLDTVNCKGRVYPMDLKGKIPEETYSAMKVQWAKANPDLVPKREPEVYKPEMEKKVYSPPKPVATGADIPSPNPPAQITYEEDDDEPIYLIPHKLPDGTFNHVGDGIQDLVGTLEAEDFSGKCPFEDCEGLIYPADVKGIISKDVYQTFRTKFAEKHPELASAQVGGAEDMDVSDITALLNDPTIRAFLGTPGVDSAQSMLEPPDPNETCDVPKKQGKGRKTYRRKIRGRTLRTSSRRRNKNGRRLTRKS